MTTIRLTFCCMHDNCTKASTDSTDFKTVHVESGPLTFAYLLCNEHAEELLQWQARIDAARTTKKEETNG